MLPTLARGAVVAGAAGLVAALPSTLGLTSPWPVLLVAAVALVRPLRAGTIVAVLVGAGAWWLGIALRAGLLPDATSSLVIAAIVAVAVCVAVAAATGDRLPLWASLAGIAAFGGIYEPTFATDPTHFLTDSVVALGTVVVAVGLGTLAAVAADLLATTPAPRRTSAPTATPGEVL